MGRPKADLAYYSPWASYPMVTPMPPDPAFLPVVPAVGLAGFSDLAVWALQYAENGAKVNLYENMYTPDQYAQLSDFTPPTAGGLTAEPLPTGTFGGIDLNGRAFWTFPTVVFTATGPGLPQLIWGYYVTVKDPITEKIVLLWASRLPTPFAFTAAGQTLPIALSLSFAQC